MTSGEKIFYVIITILSVAFGSILGNVMSKILEMSK
jgi:hypothetical protein